MATPRIAAVTLVRDSEKFIVPHLKMYKGVDRNIVLFIPQELVGGASGHGKVRDSSLQLIQKHCNDVEIYHTETNIWGAPLWNEAIELAKDCDKVIIFHADIVLAPKDWKWFYKLLRETDFDVYRLDMTKCTIDYYYDFDHGVRDCLDTEPIAVKTDIRFRKFYDIPEGKKVHTINNPTFEVHHFCGWKGIFAKKEWINGTIPSESNVYVNQLMPKGGWIECPKDVRKLFKV